MEEKEKEEKVNIRHTINAEETFTLAKDVYDIRNVIKGIYNNRAVIGRRINFLTQTISFTFTLAYIAYMLFTGLLDKIGVYADITVYCLFGVYGVLFAMLLILTACAAHAKAKNVKRLKKVIAYLRLALRIATISITILALVFAMGGEYSAQNVAVDILLIIFSVICLIAQSIPLLFGGFGKLARWLLSPVKVKYRFSAVALEWYELTLTSSTDKIFSKKVDKKYYDDIGICLDTFIVPALGRKYIATIKPAHILAVSSAAPEEDKSIVEGILKTIFAYATERGYVASDPCRDLNMEGSIEEQDKKHTGIKSRLAGLGKKIGMSLLNKYIDKSTENND